MIGCQLQKIFIRFFKNGIIVDWLVSQFSGRISNHLENYELDWFVESWVIDGTEMIPDKIQKRISPLNFIYVRTRVTRRQKRPITPQIVKYTQLHTQRDLKYCFWSSPIHWWEFYAKLPHLPTENACKFYTKRDQLQYRLASQTPYIFYSNKTKFA